MDLMKNKVTSKAVRRLFWDTKGNVNITALTFVSRRTFFNPNFNKDVEVIDALADGFQHFPLKTFNNKSVSISRFYNLPADDTTTDRRFCITFN